MCLQIQEMYICPTFLNEPVSTFFAPCVPESKPLRDRLIPNTHTHKIVEQTSFPPVHCLAGKSHHRAARGKVSLAGKLIKQSTRSPDSSVIIEIISKTITLDGRESCPDCKKGSRWRKVSAKCDGGTLAELHALSATRLALSLPCGTPYIHG